MKELPLGVNDYKDIIKGNFIYVDKTKYIYELVRREKGIYFLSHPRRFGKSLLLSTLNCLFRGKKELFKDTWIHDKWDWQEYPVIRIDLTDALTRNIDVFRKDLIQIVRKQSIDLGVSLDEKEEPRTEINEYVTRKAYTMVMSIFR
uniref:AAA-ATPase-like domain-containing protein n=1 Tax=Fervidobacterium pennivorans TaxID=93466 RepID=A0A7C4RYA3_FERPE